MANVERSSAADKSNVAACLGDHELQERVWTRGLANTIDHRGRQEGIVQSADHDRGDTDATDPVDGAGFLVVVVRSGEPMNRSGHGVVEVLDTPRAEKFLALEQARMLLELSQGLRPQALEKV